MPAKKGAKKTTKRKRQRTEEVEALDRTIYSTADAEQSLATFDVENEKYSQTVTFTSEGQFKIHPITLRDGIFKGSKAMILLPHVPVVDKNRFSFMNFPPEIRNMIYGHLFPETQTGIMISRYRGKLRGLTVTLPRCEVHAYNHRTFKSIFRDFAVLTASKQIYAEAALIFFSKHEFLFRTPNALADFLAALGSCLQHLQHIHLLTWSRVKWNDCLERLKVARSLRAFHMPIGSIVGPGTFTHQHYCPRSQAYQSPGQWDVQNMLDMLGPLLRHLYAQNPTIEENVSLFKFRPAYCPCPNNGGDAKADFASLVDNFQNRIRTMLQNGVNRKLKAAATEERRKEFLAMAQLPENDEIGQILAETALERRKSGRARRSTAANITYGL